MMAEIVSPDIDSSWAFIVMLSGTLSQLLTIGLSYTSAIFYSIFLEEFEESPVITAWAVNLNIFVFYIGCYVASIGVTLAGARRTIVIGCVFSTIGLMSCYFATSLMTILVMYGAVTGIGFASVYAPVFAIIASYFRKYRVLAFGVSSIGAGLGQFIYPPIVQVTMDAYHWRGSFLILAAINLNSLVIAAIVMPPRILSCNQSTVEQEPLVQSQGVRKSLEGQCRNFLLFRKLRWCLFCVSLLLISMGISGFYTHITNYGLILGFSRERAIFLPSIIGIGTISGRIFGGLLSQILGTHIVAIYMFLFSLLGVASIFVGFIKTYAGIVVGCAVAGLAVAAYGVYAEAIIHIVGVDHLSAGISYSSVFAAVGMLLGGPFSAAIYEMDPSYEKSYLIIGVIALFGAGLNMPSWLTVKNGKVKQTMAVDDEFENR